jgi:hypothetical protein
LFEHVVIFIIRVIFFLVVFLLLGAATTQIIIIIIVVAFTIFFALIDCSLLGCCHYTYNKGHCIGFHTRLCVSKSIQFLLMFNKWMVLKDSNLICKGYIVHGAQIALGPPWLVERLLIKIQVQLMTKMTW